MYAVYYHYLKKYLIALVHSIVPNGSFSPLFMFTLHLIGLLIQIWKIIPTNHWYSSAL